MFRDKSRDFRNARLTVEQANSIKSSFDAGVAMCFTFAPESSAPARISLISNILKHYLDVIFAKCDYVHFGKDTQCMRDMILLIKTDTDKESMNKMVEEIIKPSGCVSQAVFVAETNEAGIKKAVKRDFLNEKPCIVKKVNLLVDGDKLLLTIRTLSSKKEG